jgi:hypothetical protein
MMITVISVLSNEDRRTIIIDDKVKELSPLARTFLAAVRKMAAQNCQA